MAASSAVSIHPSMDGIKPGAKDFAGGTLCVNARRIR